MCGPFFLAIASFGLLSVGACLGFLTAALFAAGAEPADLPKPKKVVSISDDSAEMVWQAAASLYTLGACLREGRTLPARWRTHPARCTASPIGFRSCYTPY